jgi:hypothetical protein
MASLQQIISWFKEGLFPNEDQFRQTWLSYWHKSEKIPQTQIFGLQEIIESTTQGLIYQDPVNTIAELSTAYTSPQLRWASLVKSEGYIYSWNGIKWANTGLKVFPEDVVLKDELAQLESNYQNSYLKKTINPSLAVWNNAVVTDVNTNVFGETESVKQISYNATISAQGILGFSVYDQNFISSDSEMLLNIHATVYSDRDWGKKKVGRFGDNSVLLTTEITIRKGINNLYFQLKITGQNINIQIFMYGTTAEQGNAVVFIKDMIAYNGQKRLVTFDAVEEANQYTDKKVDTYKENKYLYAIVDAENHLLFAINEDGSLFWNKGLSIELENKFMDIFSSIQSLQEKQGQVYEVSNEYGDMVYLIKDSDNKIILGIDSDGNVRGVLEKSFKYIEEKIKNINDKIESSKILIIPCWGDSLTAANGYEAEMRSQLGNNYDVINCGVGGENSLAICGRQGGCPAYLLNPVTIPADGSEVQIGDVTDSGIRILNVSGNAAAASWLRQGQGTATVNPIFIDDIECSLRWTGATHSDTNGKYMIKRNQSGNSDHTTFSNTLIFTNGMKVYRNPYALVVWIGQNGGWNSDPNQLVKQCRLIVGFASSENYVLIGLHTGTKESRSALEVAMFNEFGMRYLNWREYCATRALADGGITSTQEDLVAMEQGACPPSLLTDGTHMTTAAYKLLGKQIINRFKYLGIIK